MRIAAQFTAWWSFKAVRQKPLALIKSAALQHQSLSPAAFWEVVSDGFVEKTFNPLLLCVLWV